MESNVSKIPSSSGVRRLNRTAARMMIKNNPEGLKKLRDSINSSSGQKNTTLRSFTSHFLDTALELNPHPILPTDSLSDVFLKEFMTMGYSPDYLSVTEDIAENYLGITDPRNRPAGMLCVTNMAHILANMIVILLLFGISVDKKEPFIRAFENSWVSREHGKSLETVLDYLHAGSKILIPTRGDDLNDNLPEFLQSEEQQKLMTRLDALMDSPEAVMDFYAVVLYFYDNVVLN